MVDASRLGRGRLPSVRGTLLGGALLALGVAMAGTAAFELLLASGAADRAATLGVTRGALGVGIGVVGCLLLARAFERDGSADDEAGDEAGETAAPQSADMYAFDT